jgi:hypothetical protein
MTDIFTAKKREEAFRKAEPILAAEYIFVLEGIAYKARAYVKARESSEEPQALQELIEALKTVNNLDD